MTREEIDEYICKCPYFSGAKCIDRSILGTHIGSCSLEFHHKKICPSSECICAGKFGLDRKVRNDMTNEEAINVLNDYDINFERHTPEEVAEAHEMAIKALEQPKTGHWIWCASSHKCSNCGGYVCFSHKKLLKYCPECGAKMEAKE